MEGQIKNYHRFYASWRRLAHHDEASEKDAVVSQYTGGRTVHLSEMQTKEYLNLCRAIEGMCGYGDQRKRQRSIALHLMQEIGIDTKDWQRINDFCQHSRICGKPFAMLDIPELEALQKKLRAIKRKGGFGKVKSEEGRVKNSSEVQQITIIQYGTDTRQNTGSPYGKGYSC